jgi:hypothetical protein
VKHSAHTDRLAITVRNDQNQNLRGHRGGLSADLTTQHPGRDTFRVTRVKGEEAFISEVQARLVAKFAQLPPDHVARAVAEAHARFEQSRVRDFVPLLVERRAGDDLFKQTQLVPS